MGRNTNADLLKCISIFGVVFIHGAFILEETIFLQYFRDMFRFSVPCFIILWAYFFEKSYNKKAKKERTRYISKRFLHLFRVYFLWSLLYFFITVDWQVVTAKNVLTKYFTGYGWAGQYFFIILFQFLLIYPVLRKIFETRILKLITIILVVVFYAFYSYYYDALPLILNKIGARPFIFWIPYVFLGIALARNTVNKISRFFLIAPLLIALEFFILNKLNLQHSPYITIGVLVASILFSVSILHIKSIEIKERLKNFIDFIGSNTLIIFVSNPLIILALERILHLEKVSSLISILPTSVKVILSLGLVLLIFMGTLFIVKFLDKTKLKKILG